MIGEVGSDIEAAIRPIAVLGGGGVALWLTLRWLWGFLGLIEGQFESLLDRARADVVRLEAELEAERISCQRQLASLSARITAQDDRINKLTKGDTS